MTVIAWDGRTLAADKRAGQSGLIRRVTKISRLKDGSLFGSAGYSAFGLQMKAWLESGAKPETFPQEQRDKEDYENVMVINASGIWLYFRSPYPVLLENDQHAMGSGRDFALAAMYLGKTAKEAVEIASVFDDGCGNGVDTLEL